MMWGPERLARGRTIATLRYGETNYLGRHTWEVKWALQKRRDIERGRKNMYIGAR